MLYGGIEAGGTKFVCAIGKGPDQILAETRFPTTIPEETLAKAVAFFKEQQGKFGEIASVGIAAFGPLDLNPKSPGFGSVTSTPKPYWAHYNIQRAVEQGLGKPVLLDTDVNGAALSEWRWGAGQGLDCLVYLTIGTGIGGGLLMNGSLAHGLLHPEMGHILIPHDRERDPFPGSCPFHGDCLEGLAAGPALEKRWGQRAEFLAPDHPAWDLEATYLAEALMNFIVTLSPQRLILGGGVMSQPHMMPLVRGKLHKLLNAYVAAPQVLDDQQLEHYIVLPGLGNLAGVLGALALAERAAA